MALITKVDGRGITTVPCASWNDFHEAVREKPSEESVIARAVWRGHAESDWLLQSALEREAAEGRFLSPSDLGNRSYVNVLSSELIRRFKANVIAIPSVTATPGRDRDWEALGRQHGLRSNLLDWTRSPYIAAFFAFRSLVASGRWTLGDKNVTIWRLSIDPTIQNLNGLSVRDDALPGNLRLHAQHALFTALESDEHIDLASYLASEGLADHLVRIDIPTRQAMEALAHLGQMGITDRTLFPDVDGAARDANTRDLYTHMADAERERSIEVD